jgi:hypothetical protein
MEGIFDLYFFFLLLLSMALEFGSKSESLLDESELSELLISLLLLPPVELELVLELELEELSPVPTTPDADVDASVAKASTAFLIEPPSVSDGSL